MMLFICNTAYQLFNAVNLKLQVFPDDEGDIILSDHSDFNDVYLRLCGSGLFENVWRTKSLYLARNFYFFSDDEKYAALMNPTKKIKACLDIDYLKYTHIFVANVDGYVNLIYRHLILNESNCKMNYFEDGWSTYTTDWSQFALSPFEKYYCYILNEAVFQKNIINIYVYEPRLGCHQDKFRYLKIPQIDKTNVMIKEKINLIFGYSTSPEYKRRCIFLEEAFSQDGYKNNDMELVNEVASKVGVEQLLLKRHPRLTENRFADKGVYANKDFNIPWEVHILNNKFSEKILFTITSGAVLTPRLVFGEATFSVYLRDLLRGPVSSIYKSKEFRQFITNFRRIYPNELYIPKTKESIMICVEAIQKEMQNREYIFDNSDVEDKLE